MLDASSTIRSASRFPLSCAWASPVHGDFIPQVGIRIQDEHSVQCPTNNPKSLRRAKYNAVPMMALSPRHSAIGDRQISG